MLNKKRLITSLCLALIAAVLTVPSVSAHGFGERYDLPVPLDYFVVGAAATVALSFLIIAFFIRKGKQEYEYPYLNIIFGVFIYRTYKTVGGLLGLFGVFSNRYRVSSITVFTVF